MSLFNIFRSKKDSDTPQEEKATPKLDGVNNVQAPPETPPVEDTAKQEAPAKAQPEGPIDTEAVTENIVKALKTVYDPEIPVDIYELGLIYEIKVEEDGNTYIQMTLTAPNCPAAGILPGQIESQARSVEGVYDVNLDLVFDPPWTPELMSEAAKLELGML
jgi:FeS assembly SUF system protein